MNTVILRPERERSLLRRHPWIFSGAVARVDGEPANGDTVRVESADGKFLAYAEWSQLSKIRGRVWSFDESDSIDGAFFEKKIADAFELRKKIFSSSLPEAYRLVHAESDGLPGVVADVYGDYAVCQFSTAGSDRFKRETASALLKYVKGVYERSDVDGRSREGLEQVTGQLAGDDVPDRIVFSENSIKYTCLPKTGHKTGFYLDQRMSRLAASNAARGMNDVLNCFCYTGGFGLAALKGGAGKVLNVDCSAAALETARENAALNGFSADAFETLEADVFSFLRKCRDSRRTFDMIILDPPKFADTVAQAQKAARGYKDINLLAMKLLRPGGRLFTFSCSGAMTDDLFGKVVDSAACDSGRDFLITGYLSQGPDHPVSAAFPEGRYLKGITGFVK